MITKRTFLERLVKGTAAAIFVPKLIVPVWKRIEPVEWTFPANMGNTIRCVSPLNPHDYESMQFNFIPHFNDFWKNYIGIMENDIVISTVKAA